MTKKLSYILASFCLLTFFWMEAQSQPSNIQDADSSIRPRTYVEDFKENYQEEAYVYEREESVGLYTRFIEWLKQVIADFFNIQNSKTTNTVVEVLEFAAYAIAIIVAVYFIVRALMNGEGRWVFGKASDKKIMRYEDMETDIHEIDFDKRITEAVQNKDYRLAVRFQYLRMLKRLSEAEIIQFDPDKTNLEYTYEIKNDMTRHNFQYASYLYNYIWYGEFAINEAEYKRAQVSFDTFLKNMAA